MKPPIPPQKRRASVSHASSPAKRTRSVSISVKVSHDSVPTEVVGISELSVVSKNQRAGFGDLPDELVVEVFKLFHCETLAKLCRTDKRCKRIAEELLYEDLDIGMLDYGLARTVAHSASLAKNVRKIRISIRQLSPIELSSSPNVYTSSTKERVQAIENILDARHIHLSESFHRDPAQGEDWMEVFNNAVPDSAVVSPNRFNHLKELKVYSYCLSIAEVSSLFRLPNLEVLVLSSLHQTTELENWGVPEGSCNVQQLELEHVLMDVTAVTRVFSSIKALKSFSYIHSTSDWEPLSEHNLRSRVPSHSWKLLGDALRKHKDSLEELKMGEITDEDILAEMYPDGRDVGTLGSLRDFPKLRLVIAQMEVLLDVKSGENDLSLYLPPQLTKLRIYVDQDDEELWVSASRS